ncbi:MAG: NADH-quinone oxidoreductase subunit J [Acidobacteriota bacterium]|nr:MAG: NADH-quinone oxidoreductase subunit J [Acidobacteriota bacterium]
MDALLTPACCVALAAITAVEAKLYIAGIVALVSGLVVVMHRNSVIGALFLVLNLLSVAVMFALLDAYFMAVLQVLIYAGAIVVLIIFVLMLLNVGREPRGGPGLGVRLMALLLGLAMVFALVRAVRSFTPGSEDGGVLTEGYGTVSQLGEALFNQYFYPFEVVSLALVAAMAGAVLLAKRYLED